MKEKKSLYIYILAMNLNHVFQWGDFVFPKNDSKWGLKYTKDGLTYTALLLIHLKENLYLFFQLSNIYFHQRKMSHLKTYAQYKTINYLS